jgi:hypothetical protein
MRNGDQYMLSDDPEPSEGTVDVTVFAHKNHDSTITRARLALCRRNSERVRGACSGMHSTTRRTIVGRLYGGTGPPAYPTVALIHLRCMREAHSLRDYRAEPCHHSR